MTSASYGPSAPWDQVAFDIETDGLLDTVTKLHSLVVTCLLTGQTISAHQGNGLIPHALGVLQNAELIAGHNIIGYDIPALQKLYPSFVLCQEVRVRDTMAMSMLMAPDVFGLDWNGPSRVRKELEDAKEMGTYRLKAWGIRLGFRKTDFAPEEPDDNEEQGGEAAVSKWANWSEDMQRYCENDVAVTVKLWDHLMSMGWPEKPIALVNRAADVCERMTREGYPFDVEAARRLYLTLSTELAKATKPLEDRFGLIVVPAKATKVWKGNRGHMVKDAEYTPVAFRKFNPTSRMHIVRGLKKVYGHEWKDWTEDSLKKAEKAKRAGNLEWKKLLVPQVDESTLEKLPFPEKDALLLCFMLSKRLGALGNGPQAWLKKERNGRIHSRYKIGGAVTGRASHSSPNIAQVPSVKHGKNKETGEEFVLYGNEGGWGWECRELFRAPPGWVQVGVDMSGLELRCLGHYLDRFGGDGGRYSRMVSDPEIDIHVVNANAWSDSNITVGRGPGKTLTYAVLYGAGDAHMGELLNPVWSDDRRRTEGARRRKLFYRQTTGLDTLIRAIEDAVRAKGWIRGLDGRRLAVRSAHAALNTLLQSAGAILCLQWLVLAWDELRAQGFKPGWDGDFVFVAWVHDEIQVQCRKGLEDRIGQILVECARKAGDAFGFRCPLDSKYIVGRSWAETH